MNQAHRAKPGIFTGQYTDVSGRGKQINLHPCIHLYALTSANAKITGDSMAMMTVRNLPDEVHRALRVRAAMHGRSTEAEVRAILAETVKSEGRIKLGSLLANIG